MTPLLSIRDLKTYFYTREGVVKSVDGVSFDVLPGQTVGIVGESGCGKSITMRSILRIVRSPGCIVSGEINFRRRQQDHLTDKALDLVQLNERSMRSIRGSDIALIPQEPMASFRAVHTVGNQMIETILAHRQIGKQDARQLAVNMLREVGVPAPEQRIDYYSWQLSGGLRQRAMIALALTSNPTLLIADEPTTALDVTTQAQILNLLRRLQEKHGMAIIIITHDLGVMAQVADYVVVMYLGRVVEQGYVENIFNNPKHPYTRALLRSMPTVESPPRTPLPSISGTVPSPYDRLPGCPFHPRCESFMTGVCDQRVPEMQLVAHDQLASCFLYDKTVIAHDA